MKQQDIKMLWGRSGNRCAFPKCDTTELAKEGSTGKNIVIGEMAHIIGEKLGSARYDPDMDEELRDGYKNRILLCPTHHRTIDKDEDLYTVEKLLEMKSEHEKWVANNLRKEEVSITFVELESITQYLASPIAEIKEEISVIPPADKIRKNQLSPEIEEYIKIGMLRSKFVEQYITEHPDTEFGERLKKGFVDKYLELKQSGISGDGLFLELFEFASNGLSDFKIRAAALAVLTYFFEKCEVFEE